MIVYSWNRRYMCIVDLSLYIVNRSITHYRIYFHYSISTNSTKLLKPRESTRFELRGTPLNTAHSTYCNTFHIIIYELYTIYIFRMVFTGKISPLLRGRTKCWQVRFLSILLYIMRYSMYTTHGFTTIMRYH